MKFDFSGWATKYGVKCTDGRTIRNNAFAHMDGEVLPLVWNHYDNSPSNVIGKAYLEHRDGEGLYVYGSFNKNPIAEDAKEAVVHGDLTHLSIRANHLKERAKQVLHGMVREVSLVIAGANSEAVIDTVMAHDDGSLDDITIEWYPDELEHSDGGSKKFPFKKKDEDYDDEDESDEDDDEPEEDEAPTKKKKENKSMKGMKHADDGGDQTIQDIVDSMNDDQKEVLYYLVGQAAEGGIDDDDDGEAEHGDYYDDYDYEEDYDMKHNVFDHETEESEGILSHAEQLSIIQSAKNDRSSLRQAWEDYASNNLVHGDDDYGVKDIEWLFPEYHNLNNPPEWLKRDTGWVQVVMNGVHKTPFSRIKSMQADIREDDARAKGYMKGNRKKEEVFSLLKRTTDPQTVYKKQKLDRDDIIDITSFDIVAWIKAEMRMMLDEEIARAVLIGDGRLASDDDKISEDHVRSIMADDELYSVKVPVTYPAKGSGESDEDYEQRKSKKLIRQIIKAKKEYKGSGSPKFFTTENYLTDMLLIEDTNGRIIYDSVDKLKNTLRVTDIVTVEAMEGSKYTYKGIEYDVVGIIVNLQDYNVGADKGGAVSMFEDFDIDYNQEKYLIETRISGALIKPFSALVILEKPATTGGSTNP